MPLETYYNVITTDDDYVAEIEIETAAEITSMSSDSHSALRELDYEHSGHIGFAGIKYGTKEEWESQPSYVPDKNIIIIYSDYYQTEEGKNVVGIKIGDGESSIENLSFITESLSETLEEKIAELSAELESESIERQERDEALSERITELEKTGFSKQDISTNSIVVQYAKSTSSIILSTNNIWENQISPVTDTQWSSAYGNGYFVSIGDNSSVIYSTDGKNWTKVVDPNLVGSLKYICYGNGYFVIAVPSTRKIYRSYIPDSWEAISTVGMVPKSLQYVNNKFIITCVGGWILSSSDGINWEKTQLNISNMALSVSYGTKPMGKYIAVGENGDIAYSYNGKNWVEESIKPSSSTIKSSLYVNGIFVINTEKEIKYSLNGYTWFKASTPSVQGLVIQKIIYGEGRYYAILASTNSHTGQVWLSSNGKIYEMSYSIGFIPNTISYGNDIFIISGENGQICSLEMGIIWTYEKPTLEDNEYLWGRNVLFTTNGDEYSSDAYYIYVPRNVSELTNDAGYITKYVDDLEYYYTKAQTDNLLDEKVNYSDEIPKRDIDILFNNNE